ncbi:DUF4097 family beta strand repeat-containing protein [Streptomyces albipurpureus]|uniref:DUF4097 family beta strand repeat-containing protein n=1 Tax=Streptomyces albipurpureus TaxID=2897419 RepID=A0ABT0UKY1_9ACTN|nr:DUF4097 family beta strand repeat-containing protein [Streptomyces sp. CWNU-1]MCM2388674.1 DUF4097 family beta strand repeat-containing protein [Streptomyces sp. CWNU-1]
MAALRNSSRRPIDRRRAGVGRGLVGLVGGGGLLLGLVGCGDTNVDGAPVESKSFPLVGEALTIDSDNSTLKVVAADVKEVQVSRQVDGWVFAGSGPNPSWKMTEGKLTLRMDCDAVASDCQARHTIKVPRGVAVTVEDDNGGVTATGFTAPLRIHSENGKVTVRDTTGDLTLRSENGTVSAQGVSAKRITAESDNGAVRIGLKEGAVPDRVETLCDNGDVDIRLPQAGAPYAVTTRADNGSTQVDVPTDQGSPRKVTARSDNGSVKVRIAE